MPEDSNLVQCYNRGCGKKFDSNKNLEDDCQHHPGVPFFHDAYKGWTCCNKKCIDFTEFLNIKGCTLSKHSNEKPPEPEKPEVDKELAKEVTEVKTPARIVPSQLERPPFDSPLTTLVPTVADNLKELIHRNLEKAIDSGEIALGTSCKNGGCSASYEGPSSNETTCIHHPGCPIFHEGLKFWSCCQKRTTDFNTFLNQPGCTVGVHKWKKEAPAAGCVKCRWDWHQTGDYVIVSVYAKNYHPAKSYVKVNPIRLSVHIVFPQEGDASFDLDLELRGIISVENTTVSMLGTKVEIKMKKFEPGSWSKLDYPRPELNKPLEDIKPQVDPTPDLEVDDFEDLTGVEAVQGISQVNISEFRE